MKSLSLIFVFFSMLASAEGSAQTIGSRISQEVKQGQKYLFYLHGGIIQSRGIDAVSPYWGRYEYTAILDTLRAFGFEVISEARPRDSDLAQYARKVSAEIDSLLDSGVSAEKIIVVGASMGAGIALDVAIRTRNSKIKYAVLGICREGSWQAYLAHYSKDEIRLCGNFLSIYESSDSYGSCESYFKGQPCLSGFKEVRLNLNKGHGFLYKPYKEWVHPLVEWINGG